jgi:outer membrane lipopolysaccharide assembly protein LptE/RlpB
MKRPAFILIPILLATAGCGYHVSGHADLLPKTVKTIAIPPFANVTIRYKLTDSIPSALMREFVSRSNRYQIVNDPNQADAVLRGAVVNYMSFPVVSDQKTGRATAVQLSVFLNITLTERATGKVLFTRTNYEIRQRYEISTDQLAYFEESTTALQRVSQEVARSVVSAILEAF